MEWIGRHHENTTSSAVSPQNGIPPPRRKRKTALSPPKKVSCHYPINYIPQSLPVEGGSLREPLANDLLRERIAHIGEQSDLHKLHPSTFFPKVLRSFFKSDRSPRSPRPPSPISIRIYSLNIAISPAMPDSILEESLAKAEAMSALPLPIFCSRAARISPQLYT